MKRTLAIFFAGLLASCAHGSSAPEAASSAKPPLVANPVKHAIQAMVLTEELKDNNVSAVFEQTLCSKLFEYNDKQVACADDVRVFLETRRQEALLSGKNASLEEAMAAFDAPRRVSLSAAKAGEAIAVTVLVQDREGATLGRFQASLRASGEDVFERADEAAVRILQIK